MLSLVPYDSLRFNPDTSLYHPLTTRSLAVAAIVTFPPFFFPLSKSRKGDAISRDRYSSFASCLIRWSRRFLLWFGRVLFIVLSFFSGSFFLFGRVLFVCLSFFIIFLWQEGCGLLEPRTYFPKSNARLFPSIAVLFFLYSACFFFQLLIMDLARRFFFRTTY